MVDCQNGMEFFCNTTQENSKLTQREREVIALVARGLANEEIAEQLSISTSAVKICLHQSCIKLEAQNRAQAVISAFKERAIDLQEVYSLEEMAELLASLNCCQSEDKTEAIPTGVID